jgi:excisionase family DNA binding protein
VETPWLSAEEAAAYVKRTTKTIENWTSDGKIRVYKPDRRPLYHKNDLDAWIKKHVVEPVAASS